MFRLGRVIITLLYNHIEVYKVTVHIWDPKCAQLLCTSQYALNVT